MVYAWQHRACSSPHQSPVLAPAAVDYFNKVKDVAEEEGHHPDLHLTNFREVEVCISTHAVGGLTYPDFVLAAKLDMIEADYSPKWLKQQQEKLQQAAA